MFIPFTEMNYYEKYRRYVQELEREYKDDGVEIKGKIETIYSKYFKNFVKK